MYKVTGYFREHKVVRNFVDLYDAIDFKDSVDAHYPLKVTMEKVIDMREFVYDSWNSVMDMEKNPLRHIPDLNTRHMVLQVLAWMWCICFSMWVGSMWVFGFTAIAHVFILAAVVLTVGTFETAKRKPNFFLRMEHGTNGYHTPSRTRNMWYNGKRIELDKNDVGGEHE